MHNSSRNISNSNQPNSYGSSHEQSGHNIDKSMKNDGYKSDNHVHESSRKTDRRDYTYCSQTIYYISNHKQSYQNVGKPHQNDDYQKLRYVHTAGRQDDRMNSPCSI